MNTIYPKPRIGLRVITLLLTLLLTFPLITGCGIGRSSTPPSAVDNTHVSTESSNRPAKQPQQAKKGLSRGQKVAILAGTAALYYIYNQHKDKQGQGPEGQHYLSKNGRVYYRDAKHQVHWVTPPPKGIEVPESVAQQYRNFKGYNNSPTGRDLRDLVPAPAA